MTLFVCLFILLVVFAVGCMFVYLWISLILSYQSFCFLCQKSKKHIKIENQKACLTLLSFCLKTCFALYLCANGFVHFRTLLVFMHPYHCGKNLEIFVIVVNRSSNLSWMISEWFCWSWDLHRLVSIYLPTLYFCFAKKSSPNVNLQMKRDIELQKPVAHSSIWLGKRVSDLILKWMFIQKGQRLIL